MEYKVAAANEHFQPLIGIQIEAYDTDSPKVPIGFAKTDHGGIATFEDLEPEGQVFFRSKVTRHSGMLGKERGTEGAVKIQVTSIGSTEEV